MKIIIPGGSGHLGTMLARSFHADKHDVLVLTRNPAPAPWRVQFSDAVTMGDWSREIDGADVVINLAGRSVNCRHTPENRRAIMNSRIESTRIVGQTIKQAARPPRVWLQAATAAIYSHRFDAPNDEATGILSGNEPGLPSAWRFPVEVATAWERTLDEAPTSGTRKIKMRISIVMAPDRGSAFDILLRLVRFGLGGRQGDGKQYVSWIHHADFVRAVRWLIEHEGISGAVNFASPDPLPNANFMRELCEAWGKQVGLPAAEWMIKMGAVFLGTEPELVLKSRYVIPGRLAQEGFSFEHPTWKEAARDLCESWRRIVA